MSLWQKTMFYLGLVDEDEAERGLSVDQEPEVQVRRRATGEHAVVESDPPATAPQQQVRAERRRVEPSQPAPGVSGRRVDPPLTARRRATGEHQLSRSIESRTVRTLSDSSLESQVITASSFTDAQQLADHIRAGIPVVLDLRQVEPAMVRRLVDFASGLTYALSGSMRKIGQGVILVAPANVNISRDERRRLSELGYYQAPEAGS